MPSLAVAQPRRRTPRSLASTAPEPPGYVDLMGATRHPVEPVTLAFAGVIAMASLRPAPYDVPVAGLSPRALGALVRRHFPHLPAGLALGDGLAAVAVAGMRHDEFEDLVDLLCESRTVPDEDSTWLAYAVATACMGGNHLWQDMGLPSRGMLTSLLRTHFTALAARNVHDMKWKKFFYRELCQRAEVVCASPSCGECVDYAKCFGPET